MDPISIVVPVFNESENIMPLTREITAAMQGEAAAYEIVFVDDCSTDDTWGQIQQAQQTNPRVRGLRLSKNSGQSAATWIGIQATASPIIATLDGDLQNDPADLPQLLAALADCDFVCGVRHQRQDNRVRLISTRVARWARRLVLKVDFCDTGCGFRVFKRETLQGLFGFNGLHRFLPILVHGGGARTKEIPIHHRPRVAGISKYGVWNRLGRGIWDLFAIAWFQKRRTPRVEYTELPLPVRTDRAGATVPPR